MSVCIQHKRVVDTPTHLNENYDPHIVANVGARAIILKPLIVAYAKVMSSKSI